mmetsp:Transcript_18060/g.41449  ORF Transcript_18060/g.41449 Transcript_18060/m.41449 type:complete len:95 (-) Transcript_18060:3012-3296(-)
MFGSILPVPVFYFSFNSCFSAIFCDNLVPRDILLVPTVTKCQIFCVDGYDGGWARLLTKKSSDTLHITSNYSYLLQKLLSRSNEQGRSIFLSFA